MAVDRHAFFAELDGLTNREIEERLPSWDMERLALVQEYLEQSGLSPPKVAGPDQPEGDRAAREAALVAMQAARGANIKAVAALILSIGAMLAAILCGMLVVLR